MIGRVEIHQNDIFDASVININTNGLELRATMKSLLDEDVNRFGWVMFTTVERLPKSDSATKVRSRELGLEIGIGTRTESDVVVEMLPLRFSTRPHDGTCLLIGCFPGFVSGLGLSRRLLRTIDDFVGINSDEHLLNLRPPRKEIGVIQFGDVLE